MGIVVRRGRPDDVAVAARMPDVAREIALPRDGPCMRARGLVPAETYAPVAPLGVRDSSFRRGVVLEAARPDAHEHTARPVPARRLDVAAPRGHAAACRPGHLEPKTFRGIRPSGAHGDDPAERVGAIRDGAGSAGDLDGASDRWIEERRVRAGAALGRGARAIDDDQRAASRETPNRRHGGASLPDGVDPRDHVQRFSQRRWITQGDVGRGQQGGGRARSGLDARRGAEHDDRFAHPDVDPQHEVGGIVEMPQQHRAARASVWQHGQHKGGERRRHAPGEPALGVRSDDTGLIDDDDVCAGDGIAG